MNNFYLNRFSILIVIITISTPSFCNISRTGISLLDEGINDAKTGIERYWLIYNTHKKAKAKGTTVSYQGLKEIQIEIPPNALAIPLSVYNDFNGVIFDVLNNSMNISLFSLYQHPTPIEFSKSEFANYDIPPSLESDESFLLRITDDEPWVFNRSGYDYGAKRCDLLIVENGKYKNSVVSSYNTPISKPIFSYYTQQASKYTIKNFTLNRCSNSTYITKALLIKGYYNVDISGIQINTPSNSGLSGDAAIQLEDCAKVSVTNVSINGTYSLHDKFGYGISMSNVSSVFFSNLYAFGEWGVFGDNYVNGAILKNCTINRFDIHCYGKDILFKNCVLRDLYNQFSSVMGNVKFVRCIFNNFVPVLFESSYNAYTEFNLLFQRCTIFPTIEKNYIIYGGEICSDVINLRPELSIKKWPNVTVKGLKIYFPDDVEELYLYKIAQPYNNKSIGGKQSMKRIRYKGNNKQSYCLRKSNIVE